MAYEDQTKDVIHQRMLDASPADIDKRPGSVTYDLTGPAAVEFETAYMELDVTLDRGMPDTATGEYLERVAAALGLERKPAVKATGEVTFSGVDGSVIDAGTEVWTDSLEPIYFVTKAAVTITNGRATVAAEAKVGGKNGNVAAGAIKLTTGNLTGVTAVTNEKPFAGGVDEETDEALRERYFDRARRPITSGNANHYRAWAMEVAGIGEARIYPLWAGNGTVKVVVIDGNKRAPTPAKVAEVAAHIEAVRPIGATVTVAAATELPINVTATLTVKPGTSIATVTSAVRASLSAYLTAIAFKETVIRISRIANMILDVDGVIDYANLKVNGSTGNLTVPDGSVAIMGTVTFT
ncbi:baseplate J/gp47 family protein [Brevibacillus borstelensis]|uniref:baseplate J/gp47 family protein n=1 Tax=Brevibacillus borstelensis TaxID=45462 RepID=UPI0030D277A4